MLDATEQAYLARRPMKRLTFDGISDLYLHPLFGAYTIRQCIEREALPTRKPQRLPKLIPVSAEMERRNEACIEVFGCGLYS